MKDSITQPKSKLTGAQAKWATALFWLCIWVAAYLAVGEALLLPAPWMVVFSLLRLLITPTFWVVTVGSLLRILAGFLLGLFVGGLLAAAAVAVPAIRTLMGLPMSIIKATPVASFVILALLFIKGQWFSTFIAFLMVLPLAWSNILQGIESTDKELLEMAQVYRFSPLHTVRYIYLPSLFPYLLSAARVGMGFSWKAGIAGEVIAIPAGTIGTQLYNAKVYLNTADLFAWTAVVILLSLALEHLTMVLLGRFTPAQKRKGGRKQ
ncbi:MAG: ABC transporter permease subunit [Angelakisella sp.]